MSAFYGIVWAKVSVTPGATARTPTANPSASPAAHGGGTRCSTTNGAPSISIFPASVSGLTASINGVVIAASGTMLTRIGWAWGDGTVRTGCVYFPQSHTYARACTYTVTVTATETSGARLEASEAVTVASGWREPPARHSPEPAIVPPDWVGR